MAAMSSPAQDPSLPGGPNAETGRPGPGSPTLIEAGDDATLDLSLMRAAIQDGVLMVFGPDGDPVPPQTFGAAAAEQPHAHVRLSDGPRVQADRIAAVLAAQMGGRIGSGRGGDEAWIRTMLGIGPRPEPATDGDLLAEGRDVEVIAFGKEMMITSPAGGTFLIAEARSTTPAGISLRAADGRPIALGDLVTRLLGRADRRDADEAPTKTNEVTLSDCKTRIEDDALIIDLPEVGAVHFVSRDSAEQGSSVSVFMPDGDTATIDDLLCALSRPLTSPQARPLRDEQSPPTMIDRTPGGDPRGSGGPGSKPSRQVPLAIQLPGPLGVSPERVVLVLIHGLPHGATVSAGVASGDGSWLLSPRDLAGLSLVPPPGWTDDLALEVAAIAVDGHDGKFTSAAQAMIVSPQPVQSSLARAPIPIEIDPQMLHEQGTPLDAVIVRGLPPGATLSAGAHDPAIDGWVLLPRQIGELTVTPGEGHAEDFTLTLLGISLAGGQARPRLLAQIPVNIR